MGSPGNGRAGGLGRGIDGWTVGGGADGWGTVSPDDRYEEVEIHAKGATTTTGGRALALLVGPGYLLLDLLSPSTAWPAARRAVGTRNGEQDT